MESEESKEREKFTSTGRIARTLAHEVRNPLTNILLATEQLKEIATNNEEAMLLLDMINRNAGRINHLVSDLLNATRFGPLSVANTDINQLIDETLELAKERVESGGVKVTKSFSREVCEIAIDKEKMKVALSNIIVNALEAMEGHDGVLHVRTRHEDGKCIIEISDNGKGMNDEALQNLFEPYFSSKAKGHGLGLTNTQNIILNHNGHITVSSSPGKGASFIIRLNILPENMQIN